MESNKVNAVLTQYKDYIPNESVLKLREALQKASDACYESVIDVPIKKPITTLIFSIFLGGIGVDRFYVGDTGIGIAKLLLGWLTCGIWPFIDIFVCYKKVKKNNLKNILETIE